MKSVKTIIYRGGIAKFSLPSSWAEEYDPAGGGTFFEPNSDAGTLRINVMELDKPPDDPTKTASQFLSRIVNASSIRDLQDGVAIARSIKTVMENQKKLSLYTWQIGIRITPEHFRLIIFTYTVLARLEANMNVQQEITTIEKSISEGEYPAIRGVSGNS